MNNNGEFGLDRYDFSALENCLAQFFSGGKVLFSESIHSTNEWGMRLPLPETTAETPKAYLLLANRQSAGRGRMGRTWSSPASGDIYMSLVLNGSFPFASAGLLPLAMGLAVQRALQACLEAQVHLKWPNDVICYGKKLAGILCEARLAPDCVQSYVIGLGLNVLRGYFPPELSDIATSLRLIDAQTKWSRTELLISVLTAFFELWPLCLTQDRRLVTAYSLACMNIGRRVQATGEHGKRLEGCAEAIGEEGALLLRLRDGELRAVHSGEVLLLPEVLD